jgi:hypothetical protein
MRRVHVAKLFSCRRSRVQLGRRGVPPAASDPIFLFLCQLRQTPDGRGEQFRVVVGQCGQVGVGGVYMGQIGEKVARDDVG